MTRWQRAGSAVLATLIVIAAAAALGVMSLILFVGHCNEDLDPAAATSCADDPTWDEPLLIGGPAIVLAIVLVVVQRGRRSSWLLATAAAAVAVLGVAAAWFLTVA